MRTWQTYISMRQKEKNGQSQDMARDMKGKAKRPDIEKT